MTSTQADTDNGDSLRQNPELSSDDANSVGLA
jgi:hypothetical protein